MRDFIFELQRFATIVNNSDNTLISGTSDADSITNSGNNVSIKAGAGDDSVRFYDAVNVTIVGGKGNDTITNRGEGGAVYVYNEGDGGNDVIYGLEDSDTVYITDSYNWTSVKSGSDIIVTVGDGSIKLKNAATLSTVNLAFSTSKIHPVNIIEENQSSNALVTGTEENDSITNSGDYVSIVSGDGKDTIKSSGDYVTIESGDGNDSISSYEGDYNSIDAGDGDDNIYHGSYATITGGKGNDTMGSRYSGGSHAVYIYNEGDGNDVISLGETDKLVIASGDWSTQISGNDVIVKVGTGYITLKFAASLSAVNIVSSASDIHPINFIENTDSDTSITGTDGNDSISNYGNNVTIDAGAGNDLTKSGKGNDTIRNGGTNVSINTGAGNDSIYSYGVNVTIVGGKGNDTITNRGEGGAVYVYNEGDGGNDVIEGMGATDTVYIASGSWTSTQSDNDIIVTVGNGKILLKGAASLPAVNIVSSEADIHPINVIKNQTPSSVVTGTSDRDSIYNDQNSNSVTIDAGDSNDTIHNYYSNYVSINAGAGNDSIRNYGVNDKISLGAALSNFEVDEDNNVVLTFEEGSLTIENAANAPITFLEPNAKGKVTNSVKFFTANGILDKAKTADAKAVTLAANTSEKEFKAENYSKLVTIDGRLVANELKITGNAKANSIYAGDAGTTITGGKGNDVFIYSAGEVTIDDYNEQGKDQISLGAALSDFEVDGNNVVLTFEEGSLTIENAAGKAITFLEPNEKGKVTKSVKVFTGDDDDIFNNTNIDKATAVTLNSDATEFDAEDYSKLVTIDGRLASNELEIFGNKKANKIYAGDAGAAITGGKGNDSLWGGESADTFIYEKGDGKDFIYGFDDNDMLEILELDGKVSGTVKTNKGVSELTIKVDKTVVAVLQDYTATSFNINGDTYQISGNSLTQE